MYNILNMCHNQLQLLVPTIHQYQHWLLELRRQLFRFHNNNSYRCKFSRYLYNKLGRQFLKYNIYRQMLRTIHLCHLYQMAHYIYLFHSQNSILDCLCYLQSLLYNKNLYLKSKYHLSPLAQTFHIVFLDLSNIYRLPRILLHGRLLHSYSKLLQYCLYNKLMYHPTKSESHLLHLNKHYNMQH